MKNRDFVFLNQTHVYIYLFSIIFFCIESLSFKSTRTVEKNYILKIKMDGNVAIEPLYETKLTDLDSGCLENIFKYLPARDLLNVAEASNVFKRDASFVYASQLKVYKNPPYICDWFSSKGLFIDKSVLTCDMKLVFQTLRNFGHTLSSLYVAIRHKDVKKSRKAYGNVLMYISKYCTNLKTLSILHVPEGVLDQVEKPFENIERLFIESFNLKRNLLLELFPNLRELSYSFFQRADLASIENHFPCLEQLRLRINFCKTLDRNENFFPVFSTIIRLNPQLRGLFLPSFHTQNDQIHHNIKKNLPQLESLALSDSRYEYGVLTHHFKNVQKFTALNMQRLPMFTFDCLQEVFIGIRVHTEHFYNFIRSNPSITKLRHGNRDLNLGIIAESLPLLEEINMAYNPEHSADDIINFIKTLKHLKRIHTFKLDDENDYYRLLIILGPSWHDSPKHNCRGSLVSCDLCRINEDNFMKSKTDLLHLAREKATYILENAYLHINPFYSTQFY